MAQQQAPYSATIPGWMQQAQPKADYHGCAGSLFFSGHTLACEVYGAAASEDQNSGLTAFAYCWRRFGPPWMGSDPHKDLVCYVLGTPHPDVLLTLALSGSGLCYDVGYLASADVEQSLYAPERIWDALFEAWWVTHKATPVERALVEQVVKDDVRLIPVQQRYWKDRLAQEIVDEAEAIIGIHPYRAPQAWDHTHPLLGAPLTEALVELLRPVCIRDVAVNILGHVPDDAVDDRETAEASRYAGYGVPQAAMDATLRTKD